MNVMDWVQLAAIAIVIAAIVYGLFRWSKSQDEIFPDAAAKYGLAFTQDNQGSIFTNARQSWTLQGSVQGVPLKAVATYETRGRLRMRGTWIAIPAPQGLLPCSMNIHGSPPRAEVHLVRTGDAAFDAKRWVTSDAPDMVRRLLVPEVRAALLQCPQTELRLGVDGGHLVLSFPDTPSSAAGLQAPLEAMLVLARS